MWFRRTQVKLVIPSIRRTAYRFIGVPAGVVLGISLIMLVGYGFRAGYSALLGGLVWALPSLYFAHRLFKNVSVHAAREIIKKFYLAETVKLFLTAVLAVGILIWIPVSIAAFFLGYGVAQIVFLTMPLFLWRK